MSEHAFHRPPLTAAVLAQAAVIALGIILWMTAGKAWILVAGIGAFVPGILRELGLVRDLDEFQREASRRAAFHAYLIGGLATVLTITGLHLSGDSVRYPSDLLTLVLVILWLTWLFSYLMSFWGPQRTASTVLLAFGAFWLIFAVGSGIAEGGGGFLGILVGILMHLVVVIPFLAGAYAAHRWPRVTGWALVAASVALLALIGWRSPTLWTGRLLTMATLAVPLAASGLGLVRVRRQQAGEEA